MYAALIAEFSRQCCARIAAGEKLSDQEFAAFRTLLQARENSGRRLLGAMAGPDASFDTVSGRCGLRPAFEESRPSVAAGPTTNFPLRTGPELKPQT